MESPFEQFLQQIPDLNEQRSSTLIDYFAYFLTTIVGEPVAAVATVNHCFDDANIARYKNVSAHFARQSRRTNSRRANYVRRNGGYRLTRHREDEICATLNQNDAISDAATQSLGFEGLLHPAIVAHAYQHYANGHLRESVLNAFVAVFDLIRLRTGLDEDGVRLVTKVFSLEDPQLILSELDTESGKSDQKGFIQIYQGAFTGIRNPKAHSLIHDLTKLKAAQYLVFASLLARRVEEALYPYE